MANETPACGAFINAGRSEVVASSDSYVVCNKEGEIISDLSATDLLARLPKVDSQGRELSPQERFDSYFVKAQGGFVDENGKEWKRGDKYIKINGKPQRVSGDLLKDVAKQETAWKEKYFLSLQGLKKITQEQNEVRVGCYEMVIRRAK